MIPQLCPMKMYQSINKLVHIWFLMRTLMVFWQEYRWRIFHGTLCVYIYKKDLFYKFIRSKLYYFKSLITPFSMRNKNSKNLGLFFRANDFRFTWKQNCARSDFFIIKKKTLEYYKICLVLPVYKWPNVSRLLNVWTISRDYMITHFLEAL